MAADRGVRPPLPVAGVHPSLLRPGRPAAPGAGRAVTGYRRYHVDQLPTALTIAGLRAAGTAPDVITRILGGGQAAATALEQERRRLTVEIAERSRSLARLDRLLERTPFRPGVAHHVDLPPTRVPALRVEADFDELTSAIPRAIATLRAHLRSRRLLVPETGWGALLPLHIDRRVRGQVFARGGTEPAAGGPATIALPHGPAFEIVHHGGHEQLGLAYDRVFTAISDRGYRPRGMVVEDYLADPSGTSAVLVRIRVPVGPAQPRGPLG